MLVTLKNDFHNTEVRLSCDLLSHDPYRYTIYPTISQIERAKRALCPVADCQCSGDCGTRGPQEHNGKRLIVDTSSMLG
jgi:hypothetical protein